MEQNSGQHAQNRQRYGPKIGHTDRASKTQHDRPAREMARPGRAGWHGRATTHGLTQGRASTVRGRTAGRASWHGRAKWRRGAGG